MQMSIKNDNYCYQFYGLNLSINRLLPGLVTVNSSALIDVAIHLVGEQQSQPPLLDQAFGMCRLSGMNKQASICGQRTGMTALTGG